jgi:hypothetical protein
MIAQTARRPVAAAITPKGQLALALARLDRAWDAVPPPIQLRLIAAIAAVADDYQPARHERAVKVPLIARLTV